MMTILSNGHGGNRNKVMNDKDELKPGHATDSEYDDDTLSTQSQMILSPSSSLGEEDDEDSSKTGGKTTSSGNRSKDTPMIRTPPRVPPSPSSSSSTTTPRRSSSNRKIVVNSSTSDLRTVRVLAERLQQAELDVTAEREARLKKDRNLRKLAKELNNRFLRAAQDAKRIAELESSLDSTQQELVRIKAEHQQQMAALTQANTTTNRSPERSPPRPEQDNRMERSHDGSFRRLSLDLVLVHREADKLREELEEERRLRQQSQHRTIMVRWTWTWWSSVCDLMRLTYKDITSPTRKNGMGLPIGCLVRQFFRYTGK